MLGEIVGADRLTESERKGGEGEIAVLSMLLEPGLR
jgi:hypothetical protein